MTLWKARNEAIHGHDLVSQQQARKRRLRLEMELLHAQRDQVLECDTDVFMGDTQAELTHFLDISTATHIQNWLHIWKPFILSSVRSAKDLSIQGVQTMSTYFTPINNTPLRPINDRSHRTARPRIRQQRALPQPSYRFRSLRSFFALQPDPQTPT